jgi:16S rRNA C1402 N4-methylase RsmH
MDKDPIAVASAQEISDSRFRIVHSGFERMSGVMRELGVEKGGWCAVGLGGVVAAIGRCTTGI